MAIRDTAAGLISDVDEGKLHPRIAACLVQLMCLYMREVEKTRIERRLANLHASSLEAFMNTKRFHSLWLDAF